MNVKILSVLLYLLKWLGWCVQYVFVWPAATLMLLLIMLFRMDNTTPGAMMAQEIASVTYDVRLGEYRIPVCQDKTPDSRFPEATADRKRSVCSNSVITDAEGYAAHIDSSLRIIPGLWAVMAAVFAGMALLLGIRPCFHRYYGGGMRLAAVRYGTPASRMRTDDSKQGDGHE